MISSSENFHFDWETDAKGQIVLSQKLLGQTIQSILLTVDTAKNLMDELPVMIDSADNQ